MQCSEINRQMECLKPQEQKILVTHFGLNGQDPHTLEKLEKNGSYKKESDKSRQKH